MSSITFIGLMAAFHLHSSFFISFHLVTIIGMLFIYLYLILLSIYEGQEGGVEVECVEGRN